MHDKPAQPTLLVVFSHGKESGPNGSKIQALVEVARAAGAQTLSIDYREHPAGVMHDHDLPGEAGRRVAQLLATPLPRADQVILVGSSMGGYVSAVAAARMRVDGLFLLAPALGIPGYALEQGQRPAPETEIVHGWRDDLIPWQNSVRFADQWRCALHLLDADHRLDGMIPELRHLFAGFLRRPAFAPDGRG